MIVIAQGVNVVQSINMRLVVQLLGLKPQCFHGLWPAYLATLRGREAHMDVNHETVKPESNRKKQNPAVLQAKKDDSKVAHDYNSVSILLHLASSCFILLHLASSCFILLTFILLHFAHVHLASF